MVKKKIVLLCSLVVLLIGGIAMFNLNGNDFSVNKIFQSPRDKQLEYLKKHEQEIIEWMISQYPKVNSIQFDWDTLRVGPVSNGIVTTHYNLSVRGKFNYNPDTVISIDFFLKNKEDIPNIEKMGMNQPPRIKRGKVLDIYE